MSWSNDLQLDETQESPMRMPFFRWLTSNLGFTTPDTPRKTSKIWDLFFKDYEWLNKARESGHPPILVGKGLKRMYHGRIKDWEREHLCFLCEGYEDPTLFKKCLQPHFLHTHGRMVAYDYAFEAHHITLNASCAFSANLAHQVLTRWPERLSEFTSRERQSSYLIYGEKTVRGAQVFGLGKNLQADESVAQICEIIIGSKDGKQISCLVCSQTPSLFTQNHSSHTFEYADDYDEVYRNYIEIKLKQYIEGPRTRKCEACTMKGEENFDRL